MPTPATGRVHREVVSYVRRSARMNDSQAKAWARNTDLLVDVERGQLSTSVAPQSPLVVREIFGRTAPLVVEIGSGAGDALVFAAAADPGTDFLAFEVFEPSIASTLGKIAARGLTNVRVVVADGAQGLTYLIEPESVTDIRVWFPDPWHKVRHHKRRLVSPEFAALVAARLVRGGVLRLATDWADYAESMREVLDAEPGLVNAHDGWAPRFDGRPETKYEARGIAAGRTIHDLEYRRP